jgi:hypothetical protein
MRPAVGRLILTIALFVGWLGYLGYLVQCRPHTSDGRPLTLSRPQFLVSTVDVVARVDNDKGTDVIVEEVLSPKEKPPLEVGDKIQVADILKCQPLPDPLAKTQFEFRSFRWIPKEPALDWTGPGRYILALQSDPKEGKGHFRVVPTPRSPGYPPPPPREAPADYPRFGEPGPPRIYPATAELLAEYRDISKTR